MKIVFTGGGSGGHFYPLIAVAEAVRDIVKRDRLLEPRLYYISDEPFDERALFENGIEFKRTSAGKIRRYFSILNFFDLFKTFFGVLRAVMLLYRIYPDVVFSKGAYASFPTLCAARVLGIPVVIHESDSSPGRANLWAKNFARYIAISFPDAAAAFPKDKVALVGNPIRKAVREPAFEGAREYLDLEENVPTILILGGSLGAERINETILEALPRLVQRYQIIHQTGEAQFIEISTTAKVVLEGNQLEKRYKPFAYLNEVALRMSAGAAALVVSRAGSGAIYELASWGLPAILIPIPIDVSHDQRKNAFTYAREGAALVIEENNLTPNLLASEIDRLIEHPETREGMKKAAKAFSRPDAAEKIAQILVSIALSHEPK